MRIAILGAPGAGKSEFAKELRDELRRTVVGFFAIIDGYMESLQARTHLAYGPFGNHIDDLQVVFKRREWELEVPADHIISVGTILDSTAHCFVRSEDTAHTPRELSLTRERLRTVAETFGLLYTDTWDYDYAFYLPYRGDDPYSRLIDTALVDLMRSYAPPVFSFKPEVKNDEKASTAAQTITLLEAEQLPSSDRPGVRSSSEDGEVDGDSTEPVSDVPEQGNDTHQ